MMALGAPLFPNELVEPILWHPVIFAYALVISGADLIILASLAYISRRMTKAIPLLLVLGVSFFSAALLGPLADLRQPSRAPLIFSLAHLVPTETHPGFSFIALYANLWLILIILSVIFLLFYQSYHLHLKSQAGGRLRILYRILSLGVGNEERYKKLKPFLTLLAAITIIPAVLWGIYPSVLVVFQTWLFLWRNWAILPLIFFADTFVASTAAAILVYYIIKLAHLDYDVLSPLLKVHSAGCVSVAGLLGVQLLLWNQWFDGSPLNTAFDVVVPIIYYVIALLLLSFILALASLKVTKLSVFVSIVALLGVILNKWNTLVNGQLISRTGLGVLSLELPPDWLLTTLSPIAAAIFIFIVLSSIFPLEVKEGG
jgi:predicted membrane protein